jgi:hypothetical protein
MGSNRARMMEYCQKVSNHAYVALRSLLYIDHTEPLFLELDIKIN